MFTTVHQFHNSLIDASSVTNQMVNTRRLLQSMGIDGDLFCEEAPLHFSGQSKQIAQYALEEDEQMLLLLHYSIDYLPSVLQWLAKIPHRKILVYHNITPSHFFAGIDRVRQEATQRGRKRLKELIPLVDGAWGVSEFNRQELKDVGFASTDVLPIIFDPTHYPSQPDPAILRRYSDGLNLLYVGRLAPNKRIEDLICTFAYLKQIRPNARLLIVGSLGGLKKYEAYLHALVAKLELTDVAFTGMASDAELVAYYQVAHAYLSMSEHEGFGIPLVEAMHFDLPIIAFDAGAVAETLGGSGFLLKKKDFARTAELINLIAEDGKMSENICTHQRQRLQAFLPEQIKQTLQLLLTDIE